MMFKPFITITFLLFFVEQINCMDGTKISIKDDSRVDYELNCYGLSKYGNLFLTINNFRIENGKETNVIGFSMTKTDVQIDPLFNATKGCFLQESYLNHFNDSMVFFLMDFENNQIQVNCSSSWTNYRIFEDESMAKSFKGTETFVKPIQMIKDKSDGKYSYYSFKFYVNAVDEGMYALNFHNCDGDEMSYDIVFKAEYHYDHMQADFLLFPCTTWTIITICFFILGLYWVYLFTSRQHALQNFHFMMTAIVFLLAFSNALFTIKLYFMDLRGEHKRNWITLMSFFYLTKFTILCGCLTLAILGWNFVKAIFGRIERRCLMCILGFQTILWSITYCLESFHIIIGYDFYTYLSKIYKVLDLYSVISMIIYLFIRKAGIRSPKARENLRKFQLFRFVYIMIAIYFYLDSICLMIVRISIVDYIILRFIFQISDELCTFVFFAVVGYKIQPKMLSKILALGNEGEVLPITDIHKELNDQ